MTKQMDDKELDMTEPEKPEKYVDDRAQRRAARRARRAERRAMRSRYGTPWLGGLALVLVGVIFLLRNALGVDLPGNVWGLFMLLPAAAALSTAYAFWRSDDLRLQRAAVGPLIGGLFLVLLAVMLVFNVSWQLLWPLFLIGIGVSLLLGAWRYRLS